MRRLPLGCVIPLALFALACGPEMPETPACEADAECGAGAACVESVCREGCGSHEDCGPGVVCVALEGGAGVCELDDGSGCVLSSDCPLPLVCRRRRCLNECELDVDCPFSGVCADDGEGGNVCVATGGCILDSECPAMNVCYFGSCVPECVADRDCPSDSACIESRCVRRE